MKRFKIILLFLAILVSSASIAQEAWMLETGSASFSIKNMGMTVVGNFKDLKTKIIFDDQHPELSSISGYISVNTINTGIDSRDKHLLGKDYFNSELFPKIEIKSTKIIKKGDSSFVGYFDLKIKGVSQNMEIPFTVNKATNTATFASAFTINRLDFTIGSNSWVLGDEVTIKVDMIAKK